jgi:hypothetical protein
VLLNGTAGVEVVCADLMDVSGRYDVVLANLDIRTFALSSGHIMGLLKKKGTSSSQASSAGRRRKLCGFLFPGSR